MPEQEKRDAAEAADENVSRSDASETSTAQDTVTDDPSAHQQPSSETDAGEAKNGDVQSVARVTELEEMVARLETENSELKDQYLRKQADFENYRRRMARDREDAISYANQQLLLDLTSIIDDFERAIRSAEESRDYDAFHNGVVLIEKQLTSMLERKWGLTRFDSEGQAFDPQRHEAVMSEPREDHDESMVLEDFQKGYLLHDRVLRSAKVKVSAPAGGGS